MRLAQKLHLLQCCLRSVWLSFSDHLRWYGDHMMVAFGGLIYCFWRVNILVVLILLPHLLKNKMQMTQLFSVLYQSDFSDLLLLLSF